MGDSGFDLSSIRKSAMFFLVCYLCANSVRYWRVNIKFKSIMGILRSPIVGVIQSPRFGD